MTEQVSGTNFFGPPSRKMPADFSGHFAFELFTALYLQTSRVGFEGRALQAKLRPAVGRRIPRSAEGL